MPEGKAEETVTIKVNRETRRLLKVIAGTMEETMIEVANRLAKQEAERLDIKTANEESD